VPTRFGGPWNEETLIAMLHNPVFAGHVTWRQQIVARNAHPAIVSDDEFARVQVAMRKRKGIRQKVDPTWIDGFVFHACGKRMYVQNWKHPQSGVHRPRMRCSSNFFSTNSRRKHSCQHPNQSMYADVIEDLFLADLTAALGRLAPPERIVQVLEATHRESARHRERNRQTLVHKLANLEQKRGRLLDLALDGTITKAVFIERDEGLQRELTTVQAEIAGIAPAVSLGTARATHARLASVATSVLIAARQARKPSPRSCSTWMSNASWGTVRPMFGLAIAPHLTLIVVARSISTSCVTRTTG
jgi:hypothetical protein